MRQQQAETKRQQERGKPQPYVELVVCETKQGLRLKAEPLKRSKDIEADAAVVVKLVEAALKKQPEKINEIVAVPPLLNNSLTREMDYLQAAYARLSPVNAALPL